MTIDGTYCRAFTLLFPPSTDTLTDRWVKSVTLRREHCTRCLSHSSLIHTSNPVSSHTEKKQPNIDLSNTLLLPAVDPLDNAHSRRGRKSPQADHLHRPHKAHPNFPPSLPPNNRPCLHPPKRKKTHHDHGDAAEECKENARPLNAEVGDQRDEAADEVAGCEGDAAYKGRGGGGRFEVVVVE